MRIRISPALQNVNAPVAQWIVCRSSKPCGVGSNPIGSTMKALISGHRLFKLKSYNCDWIKDAIEQSLVELPISVGLSGMASGVDLWFCQKCLDNKIPYIACIPFDEQQDLVEEDEKVIRIDLIQNASQIWKIRNSHMIEKCDCGIVVFDGNKGGTHNVFQQLVENKKPFVWINPVSEKIWKCD